MDRKRIFTIFGGSRFTSKTNAFWNVSWAYDTKIKIWFPEKKKRCSMKFGTGWLDKSALPGNRLCLVLELNTCHAATSLLSFLWLSALLQCKYMGDLHTQKFHICCTFRVAIHFICCSAALCCNGNTVDTNTQGRRGEKEFCWENEDKWLSISMWNW